jgi:NAD-dependent dihydropyrimidine dehydrogenase PreA subunit
MVKNLLYALCIVTATLGVYSGCSPVNNNAAIEVNERQCKGCARCVPVCRADAIRIVDAKAIIDVSKCFKCGNCVDICPVNAIH